MFEECGHWNRVSVNKLAIQQNSPEPKVKVFVPTYKPLQVSKCKSARFTNIITSYVSALNSDGNS